MYKIRCAVNWIDDEGWFGGELLARVVGFFADEFEVRISGEEARGDHFLHCLVCLGDEVGS